MYKTITDAENAFDEFLDELYPDMPFNLTASRVLKECDPIAYRVSFGEWADSEDIDTDELES